MRPWLLLLLPLFSVEFVYGQATYDCRRLDDCQNGGVCSISDGKCQCANGFEGYNCQIVSGTTCTTNLTCNNGGVCYVDNGTDICGCAFGYYGDTCDSESVLVTCDGSTMQLNLTFPDDFDGLVKLTGDNVPNQCAFSSSMSDGLTTYSLTVNFDQVTEGDTCGNDSLTVDSNDETGDANYTGQVEVWYNDLVVTSIDELYQLTCRHIGRDVDISKEISNVGVDAQGNLTQVEVIKPYSPVDFEIVDATGNPLPEYLYVGYEYQICFYLTDTTVYKNVYIKSCSTNNTLEPPDDKTYDIYNQGCPTKKGMRTTSIQETSNKTIDGTTFPSVCLSINAFKFIDSDNLALTCKVQLCKENNTDCDIPTTDECKAVIEAEDSATTTDPPSNATTVTPDSNDNTTNANTTDTTTDNTNNDNSTTDATPNGGDNSTTAASTVASGGKRRRKRQAEIEPDTEEKTVSTILTVYGQRTLVSDTSSQGEQQSTVEECLSQKEIMAVITVLGSVVIVLFIACFVLICILMKRKSKLTLFEPQTQPKPDRFHIPRAHVNQAYREI